MTFATQQDAEAQLAAEGWKPSQTPGYWAKRSKPDPWYGDYERTYLATVQHYRVAPEYGQPDYFDIRYC